MTNENDKDSKNKRNEISKNQDSKNKRNDTFNLDMSRSTDKSSCQPKSPNAHMIHQRTYDCDDSEGRTNRFMNPTIYSKRSVCCSTTIDPPSLDKYGDWMYPDQKYEYIPGNPQWAQRRYDGSNSETGENSELMRSYDAHQVGIQQNGCCCLRRQMMKRFCCCNFRRSCCCSHYC